MRIVCIYFSPTGTLLKSVSTIAERISILNNKNGDVLYWDFTLPQNREHIPKISKNDLVIFGTPVYAGRVPNLMLPYINSIKGDGAKVIPIVLFGNRSYGDALIELSAILTKNNFEVIAAGAFVGRHSFSNKIGEGRPDIRDNQLLSKFAEDIYDKMARGLDMGASLKRLLGQLDKELIYYKPQRANGEHIDIRKVTPKTTQSCNNCLLCAHNCPMNAISQEDPRNIIGKCIKCCRCVRICPLESKYFDDEGFNYHVKDLEESLKDVRSKPEIYL